MKTKLDVELIKVIGGETTPKFLATVGGDGKPNIVPVISIEAWDESTLIFGELMIRKTRANLRENAPVCIGIMNADGNSWWVNGRFSRFERTGEKFDRISSRPMFRYNAYSGLKSVGVIEVDEVSPRQNLNVLDVAAGVAWVTLRRGIGSITQSGEGPMPLPVEEKFARLKAAKFISWIDDLGRPTASSCMSLFSVGQSQLAVPEKELRPHPPEAGTEVAAAIITFDPIAYQVKGIIGKYRDYLGTRVARIDIDEVYSASPPLPGQRIA